MSNKSNKIKTDLLGIPFGTANHRLRKSIIWMFVKETHMDICFQCGKVIDNINDLSIEHKVSWQRANNPKEMFFDLENIAFSHLRCNIGSQRKSFDAKTSAVICEECGNPRMVDQTIRSRIANGVRRNRCMECYKSMPRGSYIKK